MIQEKEVYRLAAMGDTMLDREVGNHIKDTPEDFLFYDIRAVLETYDLVFLNLENPVSTKGTPDPIQDPHVTFCCHPDSLQVLKNLGVTIVSLGNNHMLDYGEAAINETLEHLDALRIKHVGAGRNYEEANRPLRTECNGKKIAFLSHVFIYSASTRMAKGNKPGVSEYRINKILPVIRDLSASGYQAIVSIHWGIEYSFYPLPYQMKQARLMIDNGALLILGHGPHYPQGIENYKDGQIVYSLGNFIFDEPHRFANRSFIYGVGVTEADKLRNRQIYPIHINNHVPHLIRNREKKRLQNLINNLGAIYSRKRKAFWKKTNNIYFNDIVNRVVRMRSLKFLFLPPVSFYFGIGFKNFLKKFSFTNFISISQYLLK
jgi:poly-gamma-glutamate synthesis protein (capsule biosynthesis protein)